MGDTCKQLHQHKTWIPKSRWMIALTSLATPPHRVSISQKCTRAPNCMPSERPNTSTGPPQTARHASEQRRLCMVPIDRQSCEHPCRACSRTRHESLSLVCRLDIWLGQTGRTPRQFGSASPESKLWKSRPRPRDLRRSSGRRAGVVGVAVRLGLASRFFSAMCFAVWSQPQNGWLPFV